MQEVDSENIIEFGNETICGSQDDEICLSEKFPEETHKSSVNTCSSTGMCSTPITSNSQKRMRIERDEQFKNALDAIIKRTNDQTEDETMYSAFGKTIALQLKVLPLLVASNAMAEIQNYMASIIQQNSNQDLIQVAATNANIYN